MAIKDLVNEGFLNSKQPIFVCVFSETTYADIINAIDNNKLPVCYYENRQYILVSGKDTEDIVFSCLVNNVLYILKVDTDSIWEDSTFNLQSNMLVTSIDQSSDNTHYPSAKAVYDIVDENKPNTGVLTIKRNNSSIGTFSADESTDKTINITVPTTASEVSALPDTTKYGGSISLTINSTDYKLTAQLKDQDGNNLGQSSVVDLPLESVVVGGRYDSATKKVILTLQSGQEISFSVADLVSGLQPTLVSGTNIKTIENNSLLGSGNIDLNIPTKTSDITNDSGYITSADISGKVNKTGDTMSGNLTFGDNQLLWTTKGSKYPYIGYSEGDSNDGTFLISISKDANNKHTYTTGLAIGGTSGNLLWKGVQVATTNDIHNATLTIQKNGTDIDTFSANASSNKTINITVPTSASDIGALSDDIKYGASISLSVDSTTYKITAQLKDQDGNNLGNSSIIDLPLESVVVSGRYDNTTKKVILTLKNGQEISFSIADLVSGLQPTLISGTNIKTINNETLLGSGNIEINIPDVNAKIVENGVPEVNFNLQNDITIDSTGATNGFEYGTFSGSTISGYASINGIGSSNYHMSSSYAWAKLTFTMPRAGTLIVTCANNGESTYDFGMISEIDDELAKNTSVDSGVKKSFSNQQVVEDVIYENVSAGTHFITVKYKKDGSADNGMDRFVVMAMKIPGDISKKIVNIDTGHEFPIGLDPTGDSEHPIYIDANNQPQEALMYAGGTKVTLNNVIKSGIEASFYAPTTGGTAGYSVVGAGTTSAPVWAQPPFYITCSTAAATYSKTGTCSNFKRATGSRVVVKMTNNHTSATDPTLNINSTGGASMYWVKDGAKITSANSWNAGDYLDCIFSGSYWYCAKFGVADAESGTKIYDVEWSE